MQHAASSNLSGIQGLRGLAATAVILSHVARHLDKDHGAPELITLFQPGHAGVDLFFVLSGFIILFVHHRDIGSPQRLGRYARRRFDRVMPLYWLALALTIAMARTGGHPLPSMPTFLWSASLLPSFDEPILAIAWTLQCEVVFYVFFATLICSRTAGLLAMAGWLTGIGAALALLPTTFPPAIFSAFGLEFFFGMAAAWVVLNRTIPAPRVLSAVGALAFMVAWVAESSGHLFGFGVAARLAYGIPAAMLVAGLAGAEQVRPLPLPSWLGGLGGASYSIYLFQFVFIGTVWQAWSRLGIGRHAGDWACFLALSVAAVGGGILVSVLVEKPLLRLMRGRSGPATPVSP